ncbi:MAG: nucleotidyl transferase AbiEii/AbiGii toxin family protein [Pseudomonadota bacterium]
MIEIIQQRLDSYKATNPVQEEQATKEIIQEIALYALWRARFFEVAAFQGGTSLRILHRLPRFSEDLDFMLKEPDPTFAWSRYLKDLQICFAEYGLKSEALPKDRMEQRVKKAVIKDSSISNQLKLSFYRGHPDQKISIKLEIDLLPPAGSGYVHTFLDFPTDYEVCHQDLGSNFALKIHALLCRPYLKGRDWYDFNWYIKQGISPNLLHLRNALVQWGPWQGQDTLEVDTAWLVKTLLEKIESIDWKAAAVDVEPFLRPAEQKSLELWSVRFFSQRLLQLAGG